MKCPLKGDMRTCGCPLRGQKRTWERSPDGFMVAIRCVCLECGAECRHCFDRVQHQDWPWFSSRGASQDRIERELEQRQERPDSSGSSSEFPSH